MSYKSTRKRIKFLKTLILSHIEECESDPQTGDYTYRMRKRITDLQTQLQRGELMFTAFEWNNRLGTKIMDYDGFRDGTIKPDDKMTEQEFRARAVQCTVRFSPTSHEDAAKKEYQEYLKKVDELIGNDPKETVAVYWGQIQYLRAELAAERVKNADIQNQLLKMESRILELSK